VTSTAAQRHPAAGRVWLPSRKVALRVAGALLVVAAGAFLPLALRKVSFFEVRRLELVGARYLTPGDVARALALPAGTNVFDDLTPLERRVAEMEGVLEAEVSRRLPGTLRIRVREREAVALTERRGRLVLMDVDGKVLPFDPTKPADDLPLADAHTTVGHLLVRFRAAEPELYARVDAGRRVRGDVVLESGATTWRLRADATPEEFRALALVMAELSRRGWTGWRELDTRVSGRVIVRSGPGA
jgi:cell division protein FtsQ